MTTTAPSIALATIQPAFTDPERLAPAGYLAGYRGLTREAYTLDLRQFTTWYRSRSLSLFSVRRADIESFARQLEANGRARATVTRRLSTIAGFYKYAVEEELLDYSTASLFAEKRPAGPETATTTAAGRVMWKVLVTGEHQTPGAFRTRRGGNRARHPDDPDLDRSRP